MLHTVKLWGGIFMLFFFFSNIRLDRRMKFFTVRVVRHWDGLPREAVRAPCLKTFKVKFHGAFSNLIWLKMSLPMAGGLD